MSKNEPFYVYRMPAGHELAYEVDIKDHHSQAAGGQIAAGPFPSYPIAMAWLIEHDATHPYHPIQIYTPEEFNNLSGAYVFEGQPFAFRDIAGEGYVPTPCRIRGGET